MSGFDRKRFTDLSERESKHLGCGICLNILNDAIKSGCEHSFCKNCVQQLIENNPSTCPQCPECRQPFNRKREQSDYNFVIIANYVFKRNLLANNFVNELKVKCDYEPNGCPLIVEFGLLSTHTRQCLYKLCKSCDLILGSKDHNCVEALKNSRSEDKRIINSFESKVITLEKLNQKMVEKISDLRKYKIMSTLSKKATEERLPLILKADYVTIGPIMAFAEGIQLNSDSMAMSGFNILYPLDIPKNVSYDLILDINNIREILVCVDSTIPVLVIRPLHSTSIDFSPAIELNLTNGLFFSIKNQIIYI